MAAADFPNSPTIGDFFTDSGRTWQWDGSVWNVTVDPPNALPVGGDTNAVLAKSSSTNYATQWTTTPTFVRSSATQLSYSNSFVVVEAGAASATFNAGTPYLIAELTLTTTSNNVLLVPQVAIQAAETSAYAEATFSFRTNPTSVGANGKLTAYAQALTSGNLGLELALWHNYAVEGWKAFLTAQPITTTVQNISYTVTAHQRAAYTNTSGTTGLNVLATPTVWTNTSYTKVTPDAWVNGSPAVLETAQRTGNWTLTWGDEGRVVLMNPSTTASVIIPTNAAVPFPIGTVVGIYNASAQTVNVVGDTGVTLRNARAVPQFAEASVRKRGTDEWVLVGG